MIALESSENQQVELLNLSVDLARRLFRKGFNKFKINRLLYFLSAYVYFDNQEMFINFEKGIAAFNNKERPMGIKELATQLIEQNGREKEKASFVSNLLLKSNHSLQEIAEFANVSIDFVIDIKNKLAVAEK